MIACGAATFILYPHPRKEQFRRVWNWPLRFSAACWLFFFLFAGFGTWLRQKPGFESLGDSLGTATVIAASFGIISLCLFLIVFSLAIARDLRNRKRVPAIVEPIDEVQALLLHGQTARAIELYQRENRVSDLEAKEAVEALAQALEAGLRV